MNVESVDTTEQARGYAFDLFEGYAVSSVVASLEMSGYLGILESDGIAVDGAAHSGGREQHDLLIAALRYLAHRGLVREVDGVCTLTARGREVCQDKGYLVWLVGGYGEPLRRVDAFLSGASRYGTGCDRDGRWVADGSAIIGRDDVVPHVMRLLETIDFRSVLDLGCGNALFLLGVCERFGVHGYGVDNSPAACATARENIENAGMQGRVDVVTADAGDLGTVSALADTELVTALFLMHEILAQGREVIVNYLRDLAARLPEHAYLLMAEIEPPNRDSTEQRFTPEFTYLHAMMRQSLLFAEQWEEELREGGFHVTSVVRHGMPGGVLLLAQRAPHV